MGLLAVFLNPLKLFRRSLSHHPNAASRRRKRAKPSTWHQKTGYETSADSFKSQGFLFKFPWETDTLILSHRVTALNNSGCHTSLTIYLC